MIELFFFLIKHKYQILPFFVTSFFTSKYIFGPFNWALCKLLWKAQTVRSHRVQRKKLKTLIRRFKTQQAAVEVTSSSVCFRRRANYPQPWPSGRTRESLKEEREGRRRCKCYYLYIFWKLFNSIEFCNLICFFFLIEWLQCWSFLQEGLVWHQGSLQLHSQKCRKDTCF